ALPPGRNSVQPELVLAYSTGNGNGPFGLGWGLSVPAVSRKTSRGIPRYDDTSDTFILSGVEDLVPVPGGPPGATRYRPRTGGLFPHVEHPRGAGGAFWEVRSKSGSVPLYGPPRPAGAPAGWRDPAVVADPDAPSHIFTWQLSRTVDLF